MKRKVTTIIVDFMREYVLPFSIVTLIVGLFLFFMGIIWYIFRDLATNQTLGFYSNIIEEVGDWNFYLLVIGFIVTITGAWYIFSYYKKRKFVLEEIQTNKRSELLKRHSELKNAVKHLPSKYKKMLKEKEEELRIK